MSSFLINTLFSNETTGSDLLFGSFAENTEDTEILSYPHFIPPPIFLLISEGSFLAQTL